MLFGGNVLELNTLSKLGNNLESNETQGTLIAGKKYYAAISLSEELQEFKIQESPAGSRGPKRFHRSVEMASAGSEGGVNL